MAEAGPRISLDACLAAVGMPTLSLVRENVFATIFNIARVRAPCCFMIGITTRGVRHRFYDPAIGYFLDPEVGYAHIAALALVTSREARQLERESIQLCRDRKLPGIHNQPGAGGEGAGDTDEPSFVYMVYSNVHEYHDFVLTKMRQRTQ